MKKLKLLFSMTVTVLLILVMSVSVFAEGKIFVDLQEVESDTPAQIINDRTMVPVRAITEMLGYDVYWHEDTQQVDVCEKDSNIPVIIMQIDNTVAYYSKYEEELGDSVGVEVILDSPATLINNRTFVPLRFISEAVGYVVEYDEESRDVYLFSPEYIERHQGDGKGGEPGGTADDGKGEELQGVDADGKGTVISLTNEEMEYVLKQTTNTWLEMDDEEKSELAVLIGRWWEDYENIIVEDYDDMIKVIDHQMETYYRNKVDANLFSTVCEIYEVDKTVYMTE